MNSHWLILLKPIFVINLVASVIDEIHMTVLGFVRVANRMTILEAGLITTAELIQK
ncbi:selenide [Lactiplantibacillus plantarum]|nr:selenide [Lactiplantibacillus plantarum]QBJ57087.1 selenide [Lactiplantibacillus plantarum]RDG27132.1 selenide [Lactiplantibacillus plantarum]